jgi:hypothetical protein
MEEIPYLCMERSSPAKLRFHLKSKWKLNPNKSRKVSSYTGYKVCRDFHLQLVQMQEIFNLVILANIWEHIDLFIERIFPAASSARRTHMGPCVTCRADPLARHILTCRADSLAGHILAKQISLQVILTCRADFLPYKVYCLPSRLPCKVY